MNQKHSTRQKLVKPQKMLYLFFIIYFSSSLSNINVYVFVCFGSFVSTATLLVPVLLLQHISNQLLDCYCYCCIMPAVWHCVAGTCDVGTSNLRNAGTTRGFGFR